MNLFLIRFWFSRFGGFNSRLGSLNSRLSLLREFIGNALILLTVFGNKTALLQRKSKNSLFNGNNREFGPRRRQWRAAGLVDTCGAGRSCCGRFGSPSAALRTR